MQLSVFICDLDVAEVLRLKGDIQDIIDRTVDSVALIDLGLPEERGRRCFDFLGVVPVLPHAGPVVL
jgi:CRISPR/Cas system-associated endoribonuclease Cas2